MRNDVRITPITVDHVEGFRAVVDRVARERRFLGGLEAPPLESTRQFVRNNIERGYPQFVALAGETVVGWCDVLPKSSPIYAHSGVLGIGLDKDFRGAGIGRRLMEIAIDGAWRYGLTRIELTVRAPNTNAIALYRKLGFADEGVMRNAVRVDDVYEDTLIMALLRSDASERS